MIDIHSHILPEIDDGSRSLEESIEMARVTAEEGITSIVATPHVDSPAMTPELIREKADLLNFALKDAGIPLTVLTGGEVVSGFLPELARKFSINGSDYVLLEFPLSHIPANAVEILQAYAGAGLKPVIAHPERNPSVISSPDILARMISETGAIVQITSGSLTGGFGRRPRLCSEYLLKKGLVHVIASDTHSMRVRTPGLKGGLKAAGKIIGRKKAGKLVLDNPAAIIENGTL